MKSFKEYAQDKDIEAIKSILIEEGYDEPTQEQLVALLEAGFMDKMKKWGKGAALAGTLAAAGLGMGNMMQKSSNDATNAALQKSVAAVQQDDDAMQSKTVISPNASKYFKSASDTQSDAEVQDQDGGGTQEVSKNIFVRDGVTYSVAFEPVTKFKSPQFKSTQQKILSAQARANLAKHFGGKLPSGVTVKIVNKKGKVGAVASWSQSQSDAANQISSQMGN